MAESDFEPRRRRTGPVRWLWRELSRIRLTVWVLLIMAITMIVGSIFPQGYGPETYIASWGEERYAELSKWGLLNLFHTKYFLILGGILLLNLVVCSLTRWSRRRGVGIGGAAPPSDAKPIELGKNVGDATARARDVLRSGGYKVVSGVSDVVTGRRGPWPEGVSLLYHLAMAVAIIGFILSALFSFEGDVTLYPGKPESVPIVSAGTGMFKLRNVLADWEVEGVRPLAFVRPDTTGWEERVVTLTLEEFRTEWELHEGKYYPKDWISELTVEWPIEERHIELMGRVVEAEGTTTQKDLIIEVNRPLRRAGLTFYQMAYEQTFDVVVKRGGRVVERAEAESYVPFTLKSVGGMFFPGTLRVGTLFQKYLETEPIIPHVPLKWQPPESEAPAGSAAAHGGAAEEPSGEAAPPAEGEAATQGDTLAAAEEAPPAPPERVEIGDLSLEEPLEVGGVTLILENPYEGSVLSYRHDPGVPLLYVAIVAFILGLAIRTYWPSYRVRVWVEPTRGAVKGHLQLRGTGMLGEPDRAEQRLLEAFRKAGEAPESPGEPGSPGGAAGPSPPASPTATAGGGGPLDPSYYGGPAGPPGRVEGAPDDGASGESPEGGGHKPEDA